MRSRVPSAFLAGWIGLCAGAEAFGGYPCAQSAQSNRNPLPPISFSRYADNGDYDCSRCQFGDACPRFPRYWYAYRQSYPVPHAAGVQPGPDAGGGSGRGRGH